MNTTRTPLFLMANLGSEVSRIFSALESGKGDQAKLAYLRAGHIILQIKQFPEMLPRVEEINQLVRVLDELLKEKPKYQVSRGNMEAYFQPFILRLFAQR